MASIMGELTVKVIEKWGSDVKARRAIDVNGEFRELSADIIAHTAFGSSFEEGKAIFELQQKQQELLSKILSRFNVPGSKYLPTSENEYRKKLKKTINEGLSQIVKKRIGLTEVANGDRNDNDLLGLMLAANSEVLDEREKILRMGLDELIEECKTFFFAGHETTATLLTFMFLLLGTHLEWQERLRDEVYEACGKAQLPTVDSLNYLKLVGMVMNETLRLYPPAVMLRREATTDIKLGDTLIPAGTVVGLPILAWHQDEQYWGVDAKDFHPERFEEGIAKACKVPGAYLPFSLGPRNCIGQQFAYIEAKMVVATILQRYRFRLSPEYVHSPITVLTLRPQFGVPIYFEELV
ncbi:hypothetical protein KP509_24G032600 [Ceratopteris richardii]|nr:hypothetical protein KP509_24G032600 [Ceratopteris richardii]